VQDGVNGLHFAVKDAAALAQTMERAATTPGLWDRLAAGIPPVYTVEESVRSLEALYTRLIAERQTTDAPDLPTILPPDVAAS